MRYKGEKGKAWQAVQRYIRRNETDCYTCAKKDLEGSDAQCGHYYPVAIVGSNNRLSWEPKLIHRQCSRCNGPGQGEQHAYRLHLVKDYGEATVKALEARKYKVDPVKNWQEIIDLFDSL